MSAWTPGNPPSTPEPDWLVPYDYELPPERIARRPVEPRDASRLLVLDRASGARAQTHFRHLPRLLAPGDLLVLNETRVLPARLFTRLERTGREVEVLFAHPEGEAWLAMLGPGRRLKPGDRLIPVPRPARAAPAERASVPMESASMPARSESTPAPPSSACALVLIAPAESGLWRLRAEGEVVESLLARLGRVPLPPYLDRDDTPADREWYQTVFARRDGAVAAPTAGLHFTPTLFARLERAGVTVCRTVLHVGPGTFLPVRAGRATEHSVLPERYEVPADAAEAIRRARRRGGRVVAVGTTVVRALETAARAGDSEGSRGGGASGSPDGSGRAVANDVPAGSGWTDLTIVPGYRFRAVDALITNFHLPRSSLLLLVSAFGGRERVLEAYAEARDAGFRFLSYGDAMLIF